MVEANLHVGFARGRKKKTKLKASSSELNLLFLLDNSSLPGLLRGNDLPLSTSLSSPTQNSTSWQLGKECVPLTPQLQAARELFGE